MTVTNRSVFERVTHVTKDYDQIRFTELEFFLWLNDAIGQIATLAPRSVNTLYLLELAPGAWQDLSQIDPTLSWIKLQELVCNESNGLPVGPPTRLVPRPTADAVAPTWRTHIPSLTIKEYMLDARSPLLFEVYPPAAPGAKVFAMASVRPPAQDSLDDAFPLPDRYDIPAVDYVLSRFFMKDANDQSYQARSTGHLQLFMQGLGVEQTAPDRST